MATKDNGPAMIGLQGSFYLQTNNLRDADKQSFALRKVGDDAIYGTVFTSKLPTGALWTLTLTSGYTNSTPQPSKKDAKDIRGLAAWVNAQLIAGGLTRLRQDANWTFTPMSFKTFLGQ